jgi:hypothetical protein
MAHNHGNGYQISLESEQLPWSRPPAGGREVVHEGRRIKPPAPSSTTRKPGQRRSALPSWVKELAARPSR